jgi:hypothetical protein
MLEDHRAAAGELPVKGDAIRDTAEKFCERRLAVLQPLSSASSDRAARAALSIQRSLADVKRKNADRRSTRGSVRKPARYWSMRRARVAAIRRLCG